VEKIVKRSQHLRQDPEMVYNKYKKIKKSISYNQTGVDIASW